MLLKIIENLRHYIISKLIIILVNRISDQRSSYSSYSESVQQGDVQTSPKPIEVGMILDRINS